MNYKCSSKWCNDVWMKLYLKLIRCYYVWTLLVFCENVFITVSVNTLSFVFHDLMISHLHTIWIMCWLQHFSLDQYFFKTDRIDCSNIEHKTRWQIFSQVHKICMVIIIKTWMCFVIWIRLEFETVPSNGKST